MFKGNPSMEAMLQAMNYADLNFGFAAGGGGGGGGSLAANSARLSAAMGLPAAPAPAAAIERADPMMVDFDGVALERKRFECTALPKGWIREEITRRGGLSAGKIDVCYYSPSGKKILSKPQLARHLGDSVDLSAFDFRTGKLNTLLLRKSKKESKGRSYDQNSSRSLIKSEYATALIPPIRQTASIFKQPVTVYKTQESRMKSDLKHGHQEKPKQLFWEKRLEGLKACNSMGVEQQKVDLPRGIKAVGPRIKSDTALQSIATALHLTNYPIIGQTASKTYLESNPGAFINPEQPLLYAHNVNEDDIRLQEEKVLLARRKLEETLRNFFI